MVVSKQHDQRRAALIDMKGLFLTQFYTETSGRTTTLEGLRI